jgi:DNA-binding transcriptional MerR regulator
VAEQRPARRLEKSAAAFRTISEVADELDVPQHVLRFWESKFYQIRPLKRAGGRRYYRPEDVGLLRRINDLLYKDGYTIRGVQKLLNEGPGEPASAPEQGTPQSVVMSSVPEAARRGQDAAGQATPGNPERFFLRELLEELVELRRLLRR